jgi:hypothetical protein
MYWMSEYLMVAYEAEKARRASEARRSEEPHPAQRPSYATGACKRKRNRRR